jgi:serine/threonine protein kinase
LRPSVLAYNTTVNDTLIKGKYRIVREIARSNDIVYEAQDEAFGRKIALKELNLAQGVTGQARRDRIERFHREAKAAGRLSHPHIVSIFEYGEENGRYFIAMEFLEGQTLRDKILSRGAFPIPEALEIADQILDALSYAHQRGVIHRDIKPDNIHILPGGKAKLTDFGIARLSEEPALTSNGQIFGTPSFMSPEQIAGGAIDSRSDIFSLGIVLYEMLAGRRPFQGDSVVSITYAIMNAEPPSIPGLSVGLEQVLRRALAKSPLHRFGSAEEMRQAMKSADRTPSLFLNNGTSQTGIGGYPSAPMGGMNQGGYGGVPSYPSHQSPSPPVIQGYPAPNTQHQAPLSALPPTQMHYPAQQPPMPQQYGNTYTAQLPQGYPQPNAPQAFPQPLKREPLFALSPSGKSLLNAILAAIVIGGTVAFGVIWFKNAYEQNKVKEANKKVIALVDQGANAYAQGLKTSKAEDFQKARSLFEQAWQLRPTGEARNKVLTNLLYTYVQLAQMSEKSQQWEQVHSWYKLALEIDPKNPQALKGQSNLSARLGKRDNDGTVPETPPVQTNSTTTPNPESRRLDVGDVPQDTDPNGRTEMLYREAEKLMQEAEELRYSDPDLAQKKAREAVGKSSGNVPLNNRAKQLSDSFRPTVNFGGNN